MNEMLNKLSSYNIFNYLLPGIIFAILATKTTHLNLMQGDLISGLPLYYLFGLVLSNIGSLIVKPFARRSDLVEHESYGKYLAAIEADKKIEVLSETSNSARTFATMFLVLLVLVLTDDLLRSFYMNSSLVYSIIFFLLAALLFYSHKKTSKYISLRVKNHTESVKA